MRVAKSLLMRYKIKEQASKNKVFYIIDEMIAQENFKQRKAAVKKTTDLQLKLEKIMSEKDKLQIINQAIRLLSNLCINVNFRKYRLEF